MFADNICNKEVKYRRGKDTLQGQRTMTRMVQLFGEINFVVYFSNLNYTLCWLLMKAGLWRDLHWDSSSLYNTLISDKHQAASGQGHTQQVRPLWIQRIMKASKLKLDLLSSTKLFQLRVNRMSLDKFCGYTTSIVMC